MRNPTILCVGTSFLALAYVGWQSGFANVSDLVFAISVAVLAAVCAFPIAMTIRGGSIRLDHPSTIMALVLAGYWFFGLVLRSETPNTTCLRYGDYMSASALAGALAAVSYYAGAGLPRTEDGGNGRAPEISRGGLATWWLALLIAWAARVQQVRLGVYFTHAASTADFSDLQTSSYVQLASNLSVASRVLTVALWRKHRTMAIVIFGADFAFVLFSGARLFVIHIVITACICASANRRRIPIWVLGVAAAAFVLVVNPLVYQLRSAVTGVDVSPSDVLRSSVSYGWRTAEAQDFDESLQRASAGPYLAETMCLTDNARAEPLWGSTFAEALTMLVPRVFWPSKPLAMPEADMVSVTNTRFQLKDNDGLGNPVMEGWINWSFPGIAMVFVGLGLMSRALWWYRIRHRESPARLGLYLMATVALFTFETHTTIGMLTLLRLPLGLMLLDAALRAVGVIR